MTHFLTALLFACAALGVSAQTFPTRPVTLIVPVSPGAANDLLARTLAAEMTESFGAVIVENRPGADGVIGAEMVKRAEPDGHTLLIAPMQYVILAALKPELPLNFVRDFEPVVLTNTLPFFLVVNQEALPARTLLELIDIARKQPGKFSYGSAGNGSPHHFASEMLKLQTGIDVAHIPYKGMALGLPDLLSGRIQFLITGYPAVAAHMKSGKLRLLATTASARSSLYADTPTFAESGVPNVELDVWQGIVASAKTPRAAVLRLNAEFNRVLKLPQVRQKLAAQGIDVAGGTPEAFAKRIRDDYAALSRMVKVTNIRAD